ncbi:MAG: response regulator [Desulfobacteraceae bacterium]|nr:response regulator [Desulfobacteraceae bacterium]
MNKPDQNKTAKTVLVIEDEMDMRFYLMTMVRSLGFESILTQNGVQGLDALSTLRPDLIILDVMMPEKGGAVVYQELKTNPLYNDIPLIVFSGVDFYSFTHYIKMLNLGRDIKIPFPKYYVEKSADPDYLKEVIKKCITLDRIDSHGNKGSDC